MLREICQALETIASETPLLLIFEDLHWADHSTVDLISCWPAATVSQTDAHRCHFVNKSAQRMNRRIETIPAKTMEVFANYPWPGNVRELQNFVERAGVICELKHPGRDGTRTRAARPTGIELGDRAA